MLLNYKKSFFNSNSSGIINIELEDLSQQVTNNNLKSNTNNNKNRLSAKWEIEGGKLVCKWLIN
ncbi:hypothetical protein NIES4075_27120 [Tolypothrix sp. NIES-4075]|uniref:hypothetical protein n=1 Tax=Tolypothrix sp. NIES-4075 TaxID=2005459 RepID=UPI000B5CBA79|nr:hypothetical protein [Tolypothrix sp. NIES-4075]GAX41715.1 hypothetical protein NIES4075_27120 [Tolypothrix sp. NIES-4075]